jgi:hypothetical protein
MPTAGTPQMTLFAPLPAIDATAGFEVDALVERLAVIDINRLTPLEGLTLLADVVEQARRRRR